MVNNKRKKNISLPIGYEDRLLYRFYRAIGWERTERMEVKASPTACVIHLAKLEAKGNDKYETRWTTDGPFQFEITLKTLSRNNYTAVASLVITADPSVYDDDISVLTCRAYPTFAEMAQLIFLALWTLFFVCVPAQSTSQRLPAPYAILLGVGATVAAWIMRFNGRNRLLRLVQEHVAQIQRREPITKQKAEPLAEPEFEARPMLFYPQIGKNTHEHN